MHALSKLKRSVIDEFSGVVVVAGHYRAVTDFALLILIWFWSSASLCVFICLNLIRFFSVSCAGKAVKIILEKLQSQCHPGKCVYELWRHVPALEVVKDVRMQLNDRHTHRGH